MISQKNFDWKSFIKLVAVIAVPVAFQNLLTTTGSMIDTIMIAPLGENTVGAVGLCAQFSSLMFSCYWGFVGGGNKDVVLPEMDKTRNRAGQRGFEIVLG